MTMHTATAGNSSIPADNNGWRWNTHNYCFFHRILTTWMLPVVYREDMAEDIATEVLLDYSDSTTETNLPEILSFLLTRIYCRLQEERIRLRAEQAFVAGQGNEVPWPVKFQVQERYQILNCSRHLSPPEQQFLEQSLLGEVDPEEIEIALGVKGRTLRNIRHLAIVHLQKVISGHRVKPSVL